MDSSDLIINSQVMPTALPEQVKKTDDATDAAKIKFAKDFESIFVNKLLDEMKNTIGEWGEEKDGASQQVNGMFYMFLAKDIGENGGFGMWKDIYNSLKDSGNKNTAPAILDKKI
ncbi:MAG: hypothetical protein A2Y10_16125 [Planctomycetes bacterium GWF2_41_51]|nr:MAG: hypothetical protein A2Y10_16125 [Planctomycetes bacterium GWF2_41_51]HBG26602.1 hypothetical protein [Phycisphaerales bacterium]